MVAELTTLKTVRRREVANALEVARAHGDLRENAEYEAAKQEQALLEARIGELEDKLSRVRLLEEANITGEHVSIGCVVTVTDMKTKKEEVYTLVGDEEADFKTGKISIGTPIAKGMMGKKPGETVEIVIPVGTLKYKIKSITVAP